MSRDQDHGPHPGAEDRYGLPPGRAYDPYAGSSAEAWARHQYGSADPYASGDPYTASPHGSDPYATDPLSADGFGPSFSSSAAPSGHPGDPYQGPSLDGAAGHEASGYGAPGYGAPGYGDPGYGAARPSSGSAIAGFVLGLLAVAMCGGLTSPVGIFLSARGLQETSPAAAPPRDGRGLAIAGMVLSVVGLIPLLGLLLYILLILVVVLSGSTA